MITERRVFLDERLPEQLLHRHTESKKLMRAFEPAAEGERAEDVLIHGSSGVGKTTLIRHILKREFRDQDIQSSLVNSSNTRSAILHEAAVKHQSDVAVRPNMPASDLVNALKRIVDRPYIVVLDEADTIHNLDIIRDLYKVPLLSVVAIIHEPRKWLARLDDELQDYFSLKSQVELERYSQDELVDILEPRAERGLEPGVVRDGQLEWIADEVAGVARYGIKSLLSAAEIAKERDHGHLHEQDIADSFDRARTKIRKSNLRSLPFGPCIVYELLRREDSKRIPGSQLHELYEQFAPSIYANTDQEPVARRRRVDHLNKLVEYDLIIQHGENRWAEYEVIDPGLEAPVNPHLERTTLL